MKAVFGWEKNSILLVVSQLILLEQQSHWSGLLLFFVCQVALRCDLFACVSFCVVLSSSLETGEQSWQCYSFGHNTCRRICCQVKGNWEWIWGQVFYRVRQSWLVKTRKLGGWRREKKKTTAKDVDTGYRKCTKIVSIEGGESCWGRGTNGNALLVRKPT